MKKDEQIMCEWLQQELASFVHEVWSPDSAMSNAYESEELTFDALIEAVEHMREQRPPIYYAVSNFVATDGCIIKFGAEYCKNGEVNYLIHSNTEKQFVSELEQVSLRPIRIEVKDMLKLPLVG